MPSSKEIKALIRPRSASPNDIEIFKSVAARCKFMCIHSSVTGCDTPQYRAVLDNLVILVKAIEATPGSLENLRTEFIAKSWFGPTAKPNANDLAKLVLNKIETNVKNYDMFTEILSSVTGMKQIVDIIKGLLCLLIIGSLLQSLVMFPFCSCRW